MTTKALTVELLDKLEPEKQEAALAYLQSLLAQQEANIENAKQTEPIWKIGIFKGSFEMSPDFNDPIEDFKDYM